MSTLETVPLSPTAAKIAANSPPTQPSLSSVTVPPPVSSSSSSSSTSSSSISSSSSSSSTASTSSALNSAKSFMSNALDSVKAGASKAVEATSRTFKKMGDHPTTMLCSNSKCAKQLTLPPSIWYWKCTSGHENPHTLDACSACRETKLNALGHTISWPALKCPDCGTVTTVPANAFETSVYDSGTIIQNSFYSVTKSPETFHCWNCNILLHVPAGPWICHGCATQNEPLLQNCKRCEQNRAEQTVLCGHCHQPTGVSKSGIMDSLASAMRTLKQNSTKMFLDVSGQKNVDCPTCSAPLKIPATTVQPIGANDVSGGAVPQQWTMTLVCEQCRNPVSISKQNVIPMPQQHEQAQPVSTDAIASTGIVVSRPIALPIHSSTSSTTTKSSNL